MPYGSNAPVDFETLFENRDEDFADTTIHTEPLLTPAYESYEGAGGLAEDFGGHFFEGRETFQPEYSNSWEASYPEDTFDLVETDADWAELFEAGVSHADAAREAIPGFETLSESEVDAAIEVMLENATPEQIESFWRKLKGFGRRVARGVGRVVRGVAPTVGGLIGGPIGRQIGRAAGNLVGGGLSRLGRRRSRRRPASPRRARPMGRPVGPSSPVPARGQISQQLRTLIRNPGVLQSLARSAGLVGNMRGRETFLTIDGGPVMIDSQNALTDSDIVETLSYLREQAVAESDFGESNAPYDEGYELAAELVYQRVVGSESI